MEETSNPQQAPGAFVDTRPSWDEYFMKLAEEVATRTTCLRQQLGVPSGQRHEICRGLHAEQNALLQAARYGINIEGSSIYINTQPCVVCAKMLINAGIKEIVYKNPYPDELAMELLEESGITLRVFDPE